MVGDRCIWSSQVEFQLSQRSGRSHNQDLFEQKSTWHVQFLWNNGGQQARGYNSVKVDERVGVNLPLEVEQNICLTPSEIDPDLDKETPRASLSDCGNAEQLGLSLNDALQTAKIFLGAVMSDTSNQYPAV